jgi:hypothetical protein
LPLLQVEQLDFEEPLPSVSAKQNTDISFFGPGAWQLGQVSLEPSAPRG